MAGGIEAPVLVPHADLSVNSSNSSASISEEKPAQITLFSVEELGPEVSAEPEAEVIKLTGFSHSLRWTQQRHRPR